MNAQTFLWITFFFVLAAPAHLLAEGWGPEAPTQLLPPMNSPNGQRTSRGQDDYQARPLYTGPDTIFDLADPSTLLEVDEVTAQTLLLAPQESPVPSIEPAPILEKTPPTPAIEPSKKVVTEQVDLKTVELPPLPPLQPAEVKGPMPPLMAAINPPPEPEPQRKEIHKDEGRGIASEVELNLGPMLGGVALPFAREVQAEPVPAPQPAEATKKLPIPPSTPMTPMAGVPDIAIILSNNQFFPSRIRLKEGIQTRLIFTTVNKKPAALVIERLQIQRWIAKEKEQTPTSELERSKWEVNKEVSSTKITEVTIDPKKGTYAFHDAISGATGEITVE